MTNKHILKSKPRGRPTEVTTELNKNHIVKYSLNVPKAIYKNFRREAFLCDRKMKDILIDAMLNFLNDKDKDKSK